MTMLISEALLAELAGVLRRKFTRTDKELHDLLASIQSRAELVRPTITMSGICRDPDDDRILECAVEGQADVIVSGDADLLSLHTFEGIRIITPRAFLTELAPRA